MERDSYWDSLKFVLIFLVIYGHTIDCDFPDGSFNRAMYNFIYMFHMPLFIFISGRFSHIHNKALYKRGIIRLIETYVVFQSIRTYYYFVLFDIKPSISCLTIPNYILWYLLALVFWRLMVYFLPKQWLLKSKTVLVCTFCISILSGFIPIGLPFAIQRTLAFLPFFALGYYSINIDVREHISRIPIILSVVVLICFWCLCYFLLNRDLSSVIYCAFPYWSNDIIHTIKHFGARCVFLLSSIILGAMVMRIVPNNKVLAKWGSITMFVYIYHSFIVNVLYKLAYQNIIPHNELILFVYAVTTTLGLVFFSHSKILNIILNPVSHYLKRKKEKSNT